MPANRFFATITTAVVAGALILPAASPADAVTLAPQPTSTPAASAEPTASETPALPTKQESSNTSDTPAEADAAIGEATGDPSPTSASVTPPLAEQDSAGNHVMGSSVRENEATDGSSSPRARSFSATSQAVTASRVQGMDVSAWQPTVNWAADYSNGARFAYIKATEGVSYRSSTFSSQYSGSYNAGMIRGAYVYAQPSKASGVDTANYFVANGGRWSPDGRTLPPLLDIEYGSAAQGACYGMSASAMVNWISSFTNRMHTLTGVWPAIYTTTNWWSTCTGNSARFGQHPYFVARYTTTSSSPGTLGASWGNWTMWQWASSGTFAGDQDVFNGNIAQLQAYAMGTAPVSAAPVTRVAGSDAYATSAALSRSQYKPGVSTVFIATRRAFPDALAGAAAAGKAAGPVLLSSRSTVDSTVLAEIRRLQPRRVVVLGGPAAVDDSVLTAVSSATSSPVSRQFGNDRYETAATVATMNWSTASTVYIATGTNYPDAVAVSAIAAAPKTAGPVLLTAPGSLSPAAQSAIAKLRPSKVVIVGGTSAVSARTQQMIASTVKSASGGSAVRIAGSDRFETAAAIAKSAYSTASTVYIATGMAFPDALAGGPVAAQRSAPMLLVTSGSIPAATRAAILELKPTRIVVIGGTAAVSNSVSALL